MRLENLEFRHNGTSPRDPEIIAWLPQLDSSRGEEFCYTLLWWRKNREGYYIEFVGDRPLKIDEQSLLLKMMKYGQAVLDAEFNLMES
jgi:hypothetical protein